MELKVTKVFKRKSHATGIMSIPQIIVLIRLTIMTMQSLTIKTETPYKFIVVIIICIAVKLHFC